MLTSKCISFRHGPHGPTYIVTIDAIQRIIALESQKKYFEILKTAPDWS